MRGVCKTYTVPLLALVTVPCLRMLSRPLHGAEQLPLPICEERVYWNQLWKKSIRGRPPVLASKVIWTFSVTRTTKERLCPSVIDLDAQAAQRRFWGRNLQVLTKERERALGRWSLLIFVSVLQIENTHTEYKAARGTEDSRKVLDLNAENELPLVQSSQFTSPYHNIHFLIRNEIKLQIPQATAHTV